MALGPWGDIPNSGQGLELTKVLSDGCQLRGVLQLLGCPGCGPTWETTQGPHRTTGCCTDQETF